MDLIHSYDLNDAERAAAQFYTTRDPDHDARLILLSCTIASALLGATGIWFSYTAGGPWPFAIASVGFGSALVCFLIRRTLPGPQEVAAFPSAEWITQQCIETATKRIIAETSARDICASLENSFELPYWATLSSWSFTIPENRIRLERCWISATLSGHNRIQNRTETRQIGFGLWIEDAYSLSNQAGNARKAAYKRIAEALRELSRDLLIVDPIAPGKAPYEYFSP